MNRFAGVTAFGVLLAAALAGCNGSATGLLTGATAADAPGKLGNDDPTARPIAVAWTSARVWTLAAIGARAAGATAGAGVTWAIAAADASSAAPPIRSVFIRMPPSKKWRSINALKLYAS